MLELRDYQEEAVRAILSARARGVLLDRYDYYSRVRFGQPETKYG